jgi:SAM-dependent methyltransferase
MRETVGEYSDWRFIDYEPAIAELFPHALLPYLSKGQTALDIGCNTGAVSLFLAEQGCNVLGVNLNPSAIQEAKERARATGLSSQARFLAVDITKASDLGEFDFVLMIRLLTCFSSLQSWRQLLQQAHSLIKKDGIIYIHDFKIVEGDTVYKDRYRNGEQLGWRSGNFAVNDSTGSLLFIAHHHSTGEIEEIASPYSKLELNFHHSLSMNGHECEMFEFIGRK